jgi:hypothetical protein
MCAAGRWIVYNPDTDRYGHGDDLVQAIKGTIDD